MVELAAKQPRQRSTAEFRPTEIADRIVGV
jgi:hypothetical protein